MVLASDGKVTIPEKKLYCPGAIVQIQSTTKTDVFTSQSTSYTDITGLSVAITPTASTSKVFVMVNFSAANTDGDRWHQYQLVRDSTAICIGDAEGSRGRASVHAQESDGNALPNACGNYSIHFLDSPNTTSATTYKLQGRTQGTSSPYFLINRTNNNNDDDSGSRVASTITVWEVAGT
tara:strand:- start:49 stop:585 length:537 start_codon:yes stop_codon:yes gene_type:complete